MGPRVACALLLSIALAGGAFSSPAKHPKSPSSVRAKVNRHDPAFRAGYMDGYRQGSNDSAALSNAYKDESGPVYDLADDGYNSQYGELSAYQKMFRLGYIEGYKAGWDFNSGQYNPLGAGGGGGAGGG
jgi:hypothetical protein